MRGSAFEHKRPVVARQYGTPAPVSLLTARIEAQRATIRQILYGPRVQAKLKVGAPDDKYEQEAAVAPDSDPVRP